MQSVLQFNLLEILSLLGLVHCVYIAVHLIGRSTNLSQIVIPVLFFIVLGTAFFLNLAERRWDSEISNYELMKWLFWGLIPCVSSLFVIQIIRITKGPKLYFWLAPITFILTITLASNLFYTDTPEPLFYILTTLIIGSVSLLSIWFYSKSWEHILKTVNGKERFWIVMSLIFMNTGLLGLYLMSSFVTIDNITFDISRIVLGMGFAYLGSTSLFRIYPHPIEIKDQKNDQNGKLSSQEKEIALKIEKLMIIENIYQEPGFNRTNLAQELSISETQLSRIVKSHFGKTVPKLLNYYRIQDAKELLMETKADIATIAYESGFNSVASFHRVFKDEVNTSPSEFRKNKHNS
ncbi:MAG: helix-turn-helix domain-containing protein [Pseudomonadota bacterium]